MVLQRFAEDPLIVSDLVYLDDATKSKDDRPRDEEALEMIRRAVWGMLFADYAGVVLTSPRGLTRMMNIIVVACREFGLTVSEKKAEANGRSLGGMGLTQETWCCAGRLLSKLDMDICQTSIKTGILLRAKRVTNRRRWRKKYAKKRPPSQLPLPTSAVQLLANHTLEDYCTYSPSHLFWRQRSFRRAIASSVHAVAVGSA